MWAYLTFYVGIPTPILFLVFAHATWRIVVMGKKEGSSSLGRALVRDKRQSRRAYRDASEVRLAPPCLVFSLTHKDTDTHSHARAVWGRSWS
jgi:hypothetical protein